MILLISRMFHLRIRVLLKQTSYCGIFKLLQVGVARHEPKMTCTNITLIGQVSTYIIYKKNLKQKVENIPELQCN